MRARARLHLPLALIALTSVAVLALVGCGGGGDVDHGDSVGGNDPDATSESGGSSSQDEVPTSDKLTKALITLDDMPAGWSVSPADEDEDQDDLFCGVPPLDTKFMPSARAEASFQQGGFGPFFSHVLASYSGSDAKKVMDYIRENLDCGEWTETNDDGTTTTWRGSDMSFPKLGDESVARRMTAEVPLFGALQADLVFWRRGNTVSLVGYAVLGPNTGASSLEDLAKKGDKKLVGSFPR